MSKAFTRESDAVEQLPRPRPVTVLPPGAKNYLTASGAVALRHELADLVGAKRPGLMARGKEAEEQLAAANQRIEQLEDTLRSATIVEPPAVVDDVVRFGSTVLVRGKRGTKETYRIVGVDETDLDRNWVSWLSPIAKALLNARVGQRVRFLFPSGEDQLEILSVAYE